MTECAVTAFYNEIEPFAADWLERLVEKNLITSGRVERRSIVDLRAADVEGQQAHFFAGIGGWSYALRLAGWPDDRPVWTGSCPCQPFSAAGKRGGFDDARHLWPEWFRLIRECRPPVIFGEQVASPDGLRWFDAVSADLEGAGYAVGAADLCAAGVGAPHLRQRLYFVAHAERDERRQVSADNGGRGGRGEAKRLEQRSVHSGVVELGDTDGTGVGRDTRTVSSPQGKGESERCAARRVADVSVAAGPAFWADAEWINCRDGKRRPIEPGTFPLAHGIPKRVGKLRGYGNAIVPPLAAVFVRSVLDIIDQGDARG